jgi:hypothetical protein
MLEEGSGQIEFSGDDADLAALFCGQLRVLNHPLPSHIAISELGDLVLCVMSWTSSPGFGLADVAAVALGELAESHLHRRVGKLEADDMPGFNGAVFHFFLEGSTEEPGERAEAMRRWARQANRVARERRLDSVARMTEAKDLGARSRIARGEARRARRRRAAAV